MIDELLCLLATIVVLVVVTFVRPDRLRAPRGWFWEGIRPTGETTMRPSPRHDHDEPHGAIGAHIYCTGGSRPIVVDFQNIGCQPGGYP
jgi:hypothetical protein